MEWQIRNYDYSVLDNVIIKVNKYLLLLCDSNNKVDNEYIFKLIQDWTNRKPLIILGSGASVQFNIPSMFVLGEHLKNSLNFQNKGDQDQFEEFKKSLNVHKDLERALSDINLSESVLTKIVSETWELINKYDLEAYTEIIKKKDAFPLSRLLSHLLTSAGKKISIITTNYDRIAEYASSRAGAFICTGYTQNHIGLFSSSIHKNDFSQLAGFRGQINIWKVHGSLDWFKLVNGEEYYHLPLRHFIPTDYSPSIVTPGLSKYFQTHKEPYRTILSQADIEIENASGYLCIGYGFNDEHVQPKLITQIMNHKPIIVITKKLSDKAKGLIIGNGCSEYMLIEEADDPNHTKIYSSKFGDIIIENSSLWRLDEYLNVLI